MTKVSKYEYRGIDLEWTNNVKFRILKLNPLISDIDLFNVKRGEIIFYV
jgi:hypothetical protein